MSGDEATLVWVCCKLLKRSLADDTKLRHLHWPGGHEFNVFEPRWLSSLFLAWGVRLQVVNLGVELSRLW